MLSSLFIAFKQSQQILLLHENGMMEELDKKWILLNNTNCNATDSPSTLGFRNLSKHT